MLTIKSRLYLAAVFFSFATAAIAQDKITSGIPHIVITQEEIQRQNIRKLDQLFDGQIPGMISIDRGASQTTTLLSRGFSSVNFVAIPRIYLNNIPIESLGILNEISVESIDSVVAEVGAAAGTLVGAGAAGGVVHIFSKNGTLNKKPTLTGKLSGGLDHSLYQQGNKFFQDHIVEISGGEKSIAYYTSFGYSQEGDWAPSYGNNNTYTTVNVTKYSRYSSLNVHLSLNNRTTDEPAERSGKVRYPRNITDDVTTKIYGINASINPVRWWHNDISYGSSDREFDKDQFSPMYTSRFDSLTRDVLVTSKRHGLMYHTSLTLPKFGFVSSRLSAQYDHSFLTFTSDSSVGTPSRNSPIIAVSQGAKTSWEGMYVKLGMGIGDNLALNAGARKDIKDGGSMDRGKVKNSKIRPRYDAAYTVQNPWIKNSRLVLRGAIGEVAVPQIGVVPTLVNSPIYGPYYELLANSRIKPEVLHGSEAGFVFNVGTTEFGVTFFEQKGKNGELLIAVDSVRSLFAPFTYAYQYQARNVLDVLNRGLSASFMTAYGPLTLRADYTAYHSKDYKISRQVRGYTLRNSINQYPTQNGHASLRYVDHGFKVGFDARYLGGYRDFDYINSKAYAYPAFALYDLNASKSVDWLGDVFMFVHNLADTERYGYNNSDYVYGRRIGLGLRFNLDDMLH